MNIVIRRNKTIKRRLIRLYSLCSVRLVTCFHRCIGNFIITFANPQIWDAAYVLYWCLYMYTSIHSFIKFYIRTYVSMIIRVLELLIDKNWNTFLKYSILTYLFKFVANEGECFVDWVRMSGNCHDSLRTWTVTNIDFCATLKHEKKVSKEKFQRLRVWCLLKALF